MLALALAIATFANPAPAPELQPAVQRAATWWATQGVYGPVPETVWVDELLVDGEPRSGYGEPGVVLLQRIDRARDRNPRMFCSWFLRLTRHEVGHALGLSHADADRYPVMDPSLSRGGRCARPQRARRRGPLLRPGTTVMTTRARNRP